MSSTCPGAKAIAAQLLNEQVSEYIATGSVGKLLQDIFDKIETSVDIGDPGEDYQEIFFSTTAVKNAQTVIATLDAIGSSIRDIELKLFLDDDALATYTIVWKVTRQGALATFVERAFPDPILIVQPGSDVEVADKYGNLPEGLQIQLIVEQDNAGDATNVCEGVISFKSRV